MNGMNEIRINKDVYSHCRTTDVLIVYLKNKKRNGKNYFYLCDKDFGLQESEDKQCYIAKLSTKGKGEYNG